MTFYYFFVFYYYFLFIYLLLVCFVLEACSHVLELPRSLTPTFWSTTKACSPSTFRPTPTACSLLSLSLLKFTLSGHSYASAINHKQIKIVYIPIKILILFFFFMQLKASTTKCTKVFPAPSTQHIGIRIRRRIKELWPYLHV